MYNWINLVIQTSFWHIWVVYFVLGIVIGSFLNVVIYRLPIMLQHKWYSECTSLLNVTAPIDESPKKINLLYPRSYCPNCNKSIPLWANIPLLGYFLLKGNCHFCKCTISLRYFCVELITGVLYVVAGYVSNDLLSLLATLIFLSFIICLILIDYIHFILPDELTIILLWLGILFNLDGSISGNLKSSVLGAVLGYMLLWVVYWVFKLLTKREGIGYGDFKLLAAILAWVGITGLIPITFVASGLGIVYFMIRAIYRRFSVKKTSSNYLLLEEISQEIPFGSFLGVSGILFIFFMHSFVSILG